MLDNSRSADALCRSGGEEFLMLLPESDLIAAHNVAERLRLHTQLTKMPNDVKTITISLGLSEWSDKCGYTLEEALKMADKALYAAKTQGRNQVVTAEFPII